MKVAPLAQLRRSAGRLVVVLCCVAALFAFVEVARERVAAYHYDVTRDAHYDFARARVSRITGQLQNGQLVIPPKVRPSDVLLLAVRVRSTLLGHWFEPHLEIQAGGGKFSQAFERGGSGLRYINLSQLDLSRKTSIRLGGKYLDISDQKVDLFYLQSDLDPGRQTILVISPHPDDAEIAAFGLYAGRDAYVVTVTAGEAGDAGKFSIFTRATPYFEKARTRVWNSVVVPTLGGLSPERTANLGYFDGTLEAMKANPGVAVHSITTEADSLDAFRRTQAADLISARPDRNATWANLVQDIEYVVQHVKPDIIVAPYPLLDAHPDHKMSAIALIEALKNLNWMHGSLLLYTNHLPVSPIYPYGDEGDLVSLPPGIDGIIFDGMMSNSLTPEDQARKYVALDAMVDLRDYLGTASLPGAARMFMRTLRLAIIDGDESYFRRAVRANEFFFEVRVSSLYEPGVTERIAGSSVTKH
jgi:hypothetical protein